MSTRAVSDTIPRFAALEAVLRTKRFRPIASSIRTLISVWIKDEKQVEHLRIESTLRPIALYFESAPGLQKKNKSHKDITAKELSLQMTDLHFRTELAPCMLKILIALGYSEEHLDSLSLKDFQRLEAMILAVRKELHIEASLPLRPMESTVIHARGSGEK